MRNLRASIPILLVLGALALLAGVVVTAQPTPTACPEIVTAALGRVGDLCAGQSRNSACYGNTLVRATFIDAASTAFFDNVGDVINLNLVESIETSPFDDPERAWGVSVLNVQASLPGALPGQNAVFLLLGGAQIESAVTPETAFASAPPIPVSTAFSAALLAQPDAASATLAVLSAGQPLLADAQSADRAFVRATFGDSFGWVSLAVLQPDAAITALPVYTPGASFSPMQAFFLRTGIGGVQCAQAPSALMVQGPESLTVEINANGADIAFGSTVVLRTLSADDAKAQGLTKQTDQNVSGVLEVSVLDGQAVVQNLSGGTTTINEGEWSAICLTGPENLGADGEANDQVITGECGGWTPPEQISQESRDSFGLIDDFPLNYPIDIFTATPTATFTPRPPTFTPVASQTLPPTPVPPTAIPPTAAPPTNPPPPTQTLTPVTGADLQMVIAAQLVPGVPSTLAPRFAGLGVATQPWRLILDLTLTNAGPELAQAVEVSGIFPEGILGSGDPEAGSFDPDSNTWLVGDMPPEKSLTFSGLALVDLGCGGSVSSILTITSTTPDPFPETVSYSVVADCSTLTVTPAITLTPTNTPTGLGADIGISSLTQTAAFISEGEEVCTTVSLLNNGPDDAYSTVVSDLLPVGLTLTSQSPSQGSYSAALNTWTLGSVVNGDAPTVTLCATADAGTDGQTLSTLVTLSAANDSSSGNDSAAFSVDVQTPS
ncbi:MAG TPA: DUF11 domain-containing protein [Candidatus Limnocylindrales bacterium]|nr:DUF11 domain-containing protein [Candidatus Limnocylindrales bacterium]